MSVFQREALRNGVRVLTARMPHAQSVACYVGLAAGSRLETHETRGTAHFVEHMLFTGTERRPTMSELAGEVDALGAQFNAGTRKESTIYYMRCMSEHVGRALDILADMVRHSTFDPVELEREKGVIAEEMNTIYQSPREYIDEIFESLLYGNGPLGWPVIGTKESVGAADRDRLVSFVQDWYTAQRVVVGVAGGFDEARPQIEELFGELGGGNGAVAADRTTIDDGSQVAIDQKDTDQAELAVGAATFEIDHPDRYVLELIRTILGGGMSSRLYRQLVAELGIAYTVHAVVESYVDTGSIWAQGGVTVDQTERAVAAIAAELRRLRDEPVPTDELEKARNAVKGRFVFQTETPQGLIGWGTRRELVEGFAPEPADVLAAFDRVGAEDVQRVARTYFAPGALRVAAIGPFEDTSRFERLLD
jgi:predicted Zn-dependent peptidase